MIKKLLRIQKNSNFRTKQAAELEFWKDQIDKYQEWYCGKISDLYKTPSPADEQKQNAPNKKDASILTWHKLHQEKKYLEDLELEEDAFTGLRLLDVGSGPMPSATCFKGCQIYCLEPLLDRYMEAGFPIHYYNNVTFIHATSEDIPCEHNFFDAVISVNAIDHVDNAKETADEIRRVLKPGGLFRMHVHYHSVRKCEPIVYDDELFKMLYGWCINLKRIKTAKSNFSGTVRANESFALWSNF